MNVKADKAKFFHFVGEPYVHGIMDGEAFQIAKSRNAEQRIDKIIFEPRGEWGRSPRLLCVKQIASGVGFALQKNSAPLRKISTFEEMERSTRDERDCRNRAA